ncbi:MAG TPA: hypothetical protein VNO14_11260, partial [Blastocatellia bacterium]|nr:hypothetical protein [Blastocatellia bacterium]
MAVTRCFTVYVNLDPNYRKQVEQQLRALDKENGHIWSRSLLLSSGAAGGEVDGAELLPIECGDGTRREMAERFAER